jgi:hypothetical protein
MEKTAKVLVMSSLDRNIEEWIMPHGRRLSDNSCQKKILGAEADG